MNNSVSFVQNENDICQEWDSNPKIIFNKTAFDRKAILTAYKLA